MSESSPMGRTMEYAAEHFVPLTVTFELSVSCNLKCVHCYNFDRSQPTPKAQALTPSEIFRILDEIAQAGALIVSFTGGEALLHPHLNEFIRHSRKNKLAVRVKTNGTRLTAARAKNLREAGTNDVEISLYGSSGKTHDTFTRVQGSFEKTLEGARQARKAGLGVRFSLILHRQNVKEYSSMVKLANDLGVDYQTSTDLTERYDGSPGSLQSRMTKQDLQILYKGPLGSTFAGGVNRSEHFQCGCARVSCGINQEGIVYPCIGAPIPSGSLRQQSFQEIWDQSSVFQWIRGLQLRDFKDCQKCEKRPYCQRSSGAVYCNTGDYTAKEEWFCDQAELLQNLNQETLA